MARFFIDRPIFAWVVAIFIIMAGLVSIKFLPINQYPQVTPPKIMLVASYPGADAEIIDSSVMSIMEDAMNGIDGLQYMESQSSSGSGSLTLTFSTETNEDIAQMQVQNRLSRVESRLPDMVTQLGIQVFKRSSNFLMLVALQSDTVPKDVIGDYANRNILPEIQRLPGVGSVQLFGAERAMRIWVDHNKLKALNLSFGDINTAIATQNVQIAAGTMGGLGQLKNDFHQPIVATVTVPSRMKSVEEFENLILRASADGSIVRLKDVARIELGSQGYDVGMRLNKKPTVGMGVQLSNTGNAMEVSGLIQAKMKELERYFPEGVTWTVPYDASVFVDLSISKVVHTLVEAIVLVFIVMFIFLQNWRYTLIPTIVVPIALLGALAVVYALGMSINVLTMFAMVLVIGIIVDDAIVVVENVERIMAEEGLSPKEATKKGMDQIYGAIIGITAVLIVVFIPMAFFSGSTGNIYRQFAIVMSVSIAFSAFLALSLTPALCGTLIKPLKENHHDKKGFFGWFNKWFAATAKSYERGTARLLQRGARMLILYLMIIGVAVFTMSRLPTGFIPEEDQGNLMMMYQLPPGASMERSMKTVETFENVVGSLPEVKNIAVISGFSFNGSGENVGMGFVTLKDWKEREGKGQDASSLAQKITGMMMGTLRDGYAVGIVPPAIMGLGNGNGVSFRLQDRSGKGHAALLAARNQFLGMAMQSKVLTGVRPEGLEDSPQMHIEINRDAAATQGVNFASIGTVLSTAIGSTYVNDFDNSGRLQRVIVQSEPKDRLQPEDILNLTVPNMRGEPVPLSTFATAKWVNGPTMTVRYNGYPAMKITASPAPGYSSGDVIAEMERIAHQLPQGFGFEWTDATLEEIQAGAQSYILYAFSIFIIFLCLAALYESWSIPFAVMLVVPLGFLGVVLGVWIRNTLGLGGHSYAADVYFQIGMVTVIGLSAKNAILIVEFAKDLQKSGATAYQAALTAAHLRFRPILMTSFAFILGVVPLYIASGASSASQRSIGTGVFWGMLIGTILAISFVPLFYLTVRKVFKGKEETA
ncbi:MAG: efflux RND transporter permease subunit [Neisseriaceae bacterium]|nr:efflux RND transporter permease subunit [Neisseriaceae bacterium]